MGGEEGQHDIGGDVAHPLPHHPDEGAVAGNGPRRRAIGPAAAEEQHHEGRHQGPVEGRQPPGSDRLGIDQRRSGPQGQGSEQTHDRQGNQTGQHQALPLARIEHAHVIGLGDAFRQLTRPFAEARLDDPVRHEPGDGGEQNADGQGKPPVPQRIDAIARVDQLRGRRRDAEHQQVELPGDDVAGEGA